MIVVAAIRIGLSGALVYGVYTETGIWTALAICLLVFASEIDSAMRRA